MKKLILLNIILFSFVILSQGKLPKNHTLSSKLTCKTCHECEVPTKKDPCLIACPRNQMVTVYQSADKTVNVVTLDELSKKYMPVVFSHRAHAQMSEMSGGCVICHHYNTSGPIQPCKNCHQAERKREDISKPDLEAAYHRQCINCHREWSHQNDCTSCHALKSGNTAVQKVDTKKAGFKDHPKLETPKKVVYETLDRKGKYVTFYHDEHLNLFGATCINCHQQENCTQCHDKGKATLTQKFYNAPIKIHKTADQHHKPCFSCHSDDKCTVCHSNKPEGPFNHAERTGWALNRFHESLSCTKCHGTSYKFAKLDNKCESCHKNFAAGKFDHSVTGLKLDENHKDADCTDCHKEKNFSATPTCTNCHDDKSYPKNKPGKEVRVSLKGNNKSK